MRAWAKYSLWGLGGMLALGMALGDNKPKSAPKAGSAVSAGSGWTEDPEKLPGQGNYVVQLPAVIDPAKVESQARELCARESHCKVMGWIGSANMAHVIPMLDREAAAQTLDYTVNRDSGFERALWDCRKVKLPTDRCMAKPD